MANIIVEQLPHDELEKRGVFSWPVWEKEVSDFDHSYDEEEQCYFLEGDVRISIPGHDDVHVKEKDFVIFPEGLVCTWHVVVPVKKHYKFN